LLAFVIAGCAGRPADYGADVTPPAPSGEGEGEREGEGEGENFGWLRIFEGGDIASVAARGDNTIVAVVGESLAIDGDRVAAASTVVLEVDPHGLTSWMRVFELSIGGPYLG
jgi:hypothetical protein